MKSSQFTTVVVDDEDDVREVLVSRLSASDHWKVLGEAASVSDAILEISNHKPDCIFLDIKLREGDAFKVLQLLESAKIDTPHIMLNTGYAQFEYAQKVINQYSNEVIMLLKKPFWETWEEKEKEIIGKLTELNETDSTLEINNGRMSIRVGNKTHFLKSDDIQFIEVESTNSAKCKLCTKEQVIIINKTLTKIKKIIPDHFKQISRQTIININHLKEFNHEDHVLFLNGEKRPFDVGMVYRKNIL